MCECICVLIRGISVLNVCQGVTVRFMVMIWTLICSPLILSCSVGGLGSGVGTGGLGSGEGGGGGMWFQSEIW